MLDTADLDALVAEAAVILDKAAVRFVEGRGADSAVRKKGNDFATEIDLAIERHVGRREPYYASGGAIIVQSGKDLTEVPTLIGTGGIFAHNPYADRILAGTAHAANGILRPRRARVVLDRDYVLYAAGLLVESHPAVAFKILEHHLLAGPLDARNRPLDGTPAEVAHAEHGYSCCS